MFELVGFDGTYFAVQDSVDESIDIVSMDELTLALKVGLVVNNAHLNESGSGIAFDSSKIFKFSADSSSSVEFDDDEDNFDDDDDVYYDDEEDNDSEYEDDSDDEYEEDIEDEEFVSEDEEEDYDDYDYDDEGDYAVEGETFDDEDVYYDDDDDYGSTVSRLYSFLTQEQVTVLKRYYLWYSQRIFTDAQKDPTLGMKDKKRLQEKRANLDQLRNTGGLWHYAGFVDTGYFGGGECTLGHTLRYLHLAWDVTVSDIETAFFGEMYDSNFEDAINSNNCIIFGIKCIADFFEVDSECIKALQRAQREALRDMAALCEFYENGVSDEVNKEFTLMDELMDAISGYDVKMLMFGGGETIIPKSITQFYLQFRKEGMIPPKSLIQELRDNFVGWTGHKFVGELHHPNKSVFYKNLKLLYPKAKDVLTIAETSTLYTLAFSHYAEALFLYKICGAYEYDAEKNKDEGGRSKQVKYELSSLYRTINSQCCKDIEINMTNFAKLLNILQTAIRVPDRSDLYKSPMKDKNEDTGLWEVLDSWSFDDSAIHAYGREKEEFRDHYDFIMEMHRRYGRFGKYTIEELEQKVTDSINYLVDEAEKFKEWTIARTNQYISELNDAILKRRQEEEERQRRREEERKRYEEEQAALEAQRREEEMQRLARMAEEEAKREEQRESQQSEDSNQDIKDSEVIDFLKDADLSVLDSSFSFHKQVFETISSQDRTPSSKQMYYMKQMYEKLTGVSVIKKKVSTALSDDADLQAAVKWLIDNPDKSDSKTVAICNSIARYNSISERQMKYALEAKRLYEENNK